MDATNEILIIRVKGGREEEMTDQVASETAFTLYVNDNVLVSLLCSPIELDAMAIGFMLSEGLLTDRDTLQSIRVDEETSSVYVKLKDLPENWETLFHKKTITSGCGQGVTFTDASNLKPIGQHKPLHISSSSIKELLRKFRDMSELYVNTGGVHSAAFTDGKDILLFAEDIGRHNAVDKLIGKAFLHGLDMTDKILLSSGRISGEIMTKVVRNRIPVLISRTAPTCMSITYAENNGVTLIGFARGDRMNIYTHPNKLLFAPEQDDTSNQSNDHYDTPPELQQRCCSNLVKAVHT